MRQGSKEYIFLYCSLNCYIVVKLRARIKYKMFRWNLLLLFLQTFPLDSNAGLKPFIINGKFNNIFYHVMFSFYLCDNKDAFLLHVTTLMCFICSFPNVTRKDLDSYHDSYMFSIDSCCNS